jgi:hypothetical protein
LKSLHLIFVIASLAATAQGTVISIPANGTAGVWGPGTQPATTATYGQTITAPTDSFLVDFTFFLVDGPSATQPDIDFRAYLYAWDAGTVRAVGPALFTSATTTFNPNNSAQPVSFAPNILLTPGDDYVLFFSVAGLAPGTPSAINWQIDQFVGAYTGGSLVFQYSTGTADFTGAAWNDNGFDMAATVNFSADPNAVPEPSTYALCGAAIAALGLLRRKRR